MKTKEQAAFKLQLLELRKRLLGEVGKAEEALREDVVKPGEISSVPTHPADEDVEGLDAEIAIAHNEEMLLVQRAGGDEINSVLSQPMHRSVRPVLHRQLRFQINQVHLGQLEHARRIRQRRGRRHNLVRLHGK